MDPEMHEDEDRDELPTEELLRRMQAASDRAMGLLREKSGDAATPQGTTVVDWRLQAAEAVCKAHPSLPRTFARAYALYYSAWGMFAAPGDDF